MSSPSCLRGHVQVIPQVSFGASVSIVSPVLLHVLQIRSVAQLDQLTRVTQHKSRCLAMISVGFDRPLATCRAVQQLRWMVTNLLLDYGLLHIQFLVEICVALLLHLFGEKLYATRFRVRERRDRRAAFTRARARCLPRVCGPQASRPDSRMWR